jgi:hypothetical protein
METNMEYHRTSSNPKITQRNENSAWKTTEKIQNLCNTETKHAIRQYKNYARVTNTTNIYFTQEEILLLNKVLKCNLHDKLKAA